MAKIFLKMILKRYLFKYVLKKHKLLIEINPIKGKQEGVVFEQINRYHCICLLMFKMVKKLFET